MNFNTQWLLEEEEQLLEPANTPRRNRLLSALREVVEVLVMAVLLYVGLNMFIPRYEVEGQSMEPSFHTAERVVVSRINYLFEAPQRGDIVVFRHTSGKNLIKRLIGLPGETISMEQGQVYVNGVALNEPYVAELCSAYACNNKLWTLGEDEYFVLGDNRNHSLDSHNFGPIHRDQIIGKVLARYWPPDELRVFGIN